MKAQHLIGATLGVMAVALSLGAQSEPAVVIRAARLFDSRHGVFITNAVVVVQGERIAQAGAADQVKVPAGATEINLPHATLLPGLIDAHTHLLLTGESGGRY